MKQSGTTSIVRRLMEETGLATPLATAVRRNPVELTARDHIYWGQAVCWTATSVFSIGALLVSSFHHTHLDLIIVLCVAVSIAVTHRFWRIIKEDLHHPTPNGYRFKRKDITPKW